MKQAKWLIVLALGTVVAGGAYFLASDGPNSVRTSPQELTTSQNTKMPRFRTSDLEIAIAIDPSTVRVGHNKLIVEISDSDGLPVADTEVEAFAQMPAMGVMSAMRAPADLRQTQPGRFEGSVNLSMRGEWPLTLQVKRPQGTQRLQFDLATDREGLTIATGAVPIGAAATDITGTITIDSRRRQLIGLKTGVATHRDLVKSIRAVGSVNYDERLLSQVTLKFDGFVGDLKADYVGAEITAGQVLFTVYSPALLAAQQEYLETVKRRSTSAPGHDLLQAARQRLSLWDMSSAAIEALEKRGVPQDYVAIHAPRSGTLIERNIADGSAAPRGQPLLGIADLSRVWIEAEVYEADLQLIHPGMAASVKLPYLPGRDYESTVEYVYPYLNSDSRTGRLRLSLDNSSGELKPNMYAEVFLKADLGHRLSVPEQAVIIAGASRVVFIDLGDGRLKPARIKVGRAVEGFIEVLEGLSPGDKVVTSGNFLIAAETRLKMGIQQW